MAEEKLSAAKAVLICESVESGPEGEEELRSAFLRPWVTSDEYFGFLEHVSIQLLEGAVLRGSPEIFGINTYDDDWLSSPWFDLWSQIFAHGDERARDKSVEINAALANILDSREISLALMIPLAATCTHGFWEVLLTGRSELTYEQEEFLGSAAAGLRLYEVEPYMDIFPMLSVPSARILKELLDYSSGLPGLWTPKAILETLLENEHADAEIRSQVVSMLKSEDIGGWDQDDWEEHLSDYWTAEEIQEAISRCGE